MDTIPNQNNWSSLDDLLNSPLFKQVLYDIQKEERERLLVPGDRGRRCPSNPACCDECDYLMCCTNDDGFCDKCFAENGFCEVETSNIFVQSAEQSPRLSGPVSDPSKIA